ncbi:hypothetical protein OHU11_42110 (plasmid) [Streptomyces sp. NBC_00257]|uniref:hypothetical protein n=1 Tax=unclassified Streptomyces TaxID=2593676 RepID=UPI00224CF6EF|nr:MULTISPECIES: hypothetical protein [unclassified Streptomyces]MCX5434776.1 hypothetical protein [Streptomyces sp. NBC_00062]
MTASVREVETVSRQRKRRTRSRTISHLDPIVVSKLQPHEYDLDPACISLVCPSCRTWVPIRVAATERATAKLVPHHTETAGTEDPVRCPGSHRLVTVNVTVVTWSRRLEQGVAETNGRRADRVVRKPQAGPTPAVMQIVGGLVDDKTARRMNEIHVKGCTTCSATTPRCADGHRLAEAAPKLVSAHVSACTTCAPAKPRCGDARRIAEAAPRLVRSHLAACTTCALAESRCADGRRLAQLAAHTQRTAPLRRQRQTQQEEWADQRAWGLRLLHEQQWDQHAKKVGDADLQRTDDALAALIQTLNPHKADAPQLTDWERADLMSAITLLATRKEQLDRHRR